MSTPAMAFGAGLRSILVSLWLVWSATFVISRLFLLHDAYISEANKRVDEQWLLQKCKEPEFYSNMRQHSDICTEVAKNARSNLLLKALNSVAAQTHACGTTSCLDLIFTMFSRLGWHIWRCCCSRSWSLHPTRCTCCCCSSSSGRSGSPEGRTRTRRWRMGPRTWTTRPAR